MKLNTRAFGIMATGAALAFFANAQAAHAATISTDVSATFAADTVNAVLGNFSSVPTPFPDGSFGGSFGGYNPLSGYASLQGVSFSTTNSGGVVNVNSGGLNGPNDLQSPYAVNSVYNPGAPDVVTITLPHPETAFALNYSSLFNSTTMTFTLSNGFSTSKTTPSTFGQTGFIGFISDTPFSTVTLSVPDQESWVVADFTQADELTPTPLPASCTMMLAALVMLSGMAYRGTKTGIKTPFLRKP